MESNSETQNISNQMSGLQEMNLPESFNNLAQLASMQQNVSSNVNPDVGLPVEIAIARQLLVLGLDIISVLQTLNKLMITNLVAKNPPHSTQETSASSGTSNSSAYTEMISESKSEEHYSANTVCEKLQETDGCPPNLSIVVSQSPASQVSQNVDNQSAVPNSTLSYFCDPSTVQQYPVNWSQQLRVVPTEYLTQPYKLPSVENAQTMTIIPARGVPSENTMQTAPNVYTASETNEIIRMLTEMKAELQNIDNQMMSTFRQCLIKVIEQMSNTITILQSEQQPTVLNNSTPSATNLSVVPNPEAGTAQLGLFPPAPPGLSLAPPSLSPAPPGLPRAPPGLPPAPPGLPPAPPGFPPGLPRAPPGFPPRLPLASPGLPPAPPGLPPAPPGLSPAPPGLNYWNMVPKNRGRGRLKRD